MNFFVSGGQPRLSVEIKTCVRALSTYIYDLHSTELLFSTN